MLNIVRKRGYATMSQDYSDSSYGGMASAVGVPIPLGGAAVGSLNLMYLRNSIDETRVIARFVQPLKDAAADIAQALGAIRAGGGQSVSPNN